MIILCGGAGNPVEYGIVTAMQGKSAASVNETGAGYKVMCTGSSTNPPEWQEAAQVFSHP